MLSASCIPLKDRSLEKTKGSGQCQCDLSLSEEAQAPSSSPNKRSDLTSLLCVGGDLLTASGPRRSVYDLLWLRMTADEQRQ